MGLTELIPELQPFADDLLAACSAAGLSPRVTSTIRTHSQQQRLYDRYVRGASAYPAAPPGTSAHEYGWAFDMVVAPMAALADVGAFWESAGGVWGGRNHDPIHFEYPGFKEWLRGQQGSQVSDSGLNLADVQDFLATLPIPFKADLVLMLAQWFAPSQILDYVQHPSKAVAAYPWLRALGPPFMFY